MGRVRTAPDRPSRAQAGQQGGHGRFAPAARAREAVRTLPQGAQLPCAPEGSVRTAPRTCGTRANRPRPPVARAGRAAGRTRAVRTGSKGAGGGSHAPPRVPSCLVHLRGACEPPPAPVGRVRTAPDRPSRAQAGRTRAVRTGSKGAGGGSHAPPRVPSCLVHLRGACEPPPAPVGRVRTAPDRPSRAQAGRQGGHGRFAPAARAREAVRTLPQGAQLPCAPEGSVRTAPRACGTRARDARRGAGGEAVRTPQGAAPQGSCRHLGACEPPPPRGTRSRRRGEGHWTGLILYAIRRVMRRPVAGALQPAPKCAAIRIYSELHPVCKLPTRKSDTPFHFFSQIWSGFAFRAGDRPTGEMARPKTAVLRGREGG